MCNANVRAEEIVATMSSVTIVCSGGAVLSRDVITDGRITCKNTGRSGGERGERGVLRMNVAILRGVSISPIVLAVTSSDHIDERNFVGGEKRRQRSTSIEGAFPALLATKASRITRRDWSMSL